MRQETDKRISVVEYKAWSELTGKNINPIEFDVLTSMDQAFVSSFKREVRENQERVNRHNENVAKLRGR
ncbi:MAG TPA: hypothetical protein VL020_02865 [Pseudomonadales bacterium]|nr:hypothetical protein [Pseudomonadales bacterium]